MLERISDWLDAPLNLTRGETLFIWTALLFFKALSEFTHG